MLTTAVQTCIETAFDETSFDLAIVDKASMMPTPYVLCVGLLTQERFVIAGDFRQLGPIALSRSDISLKWLHEDAFHLADIANDLSHPGLAMLSVQRRMHQKICDLINKPFYEGKLESNVSKSKTKASIFPPLPERPVVLVSLLPEDGSAVQVTDGGSRRNVKSAEIVVDLAKYYVNTSEEIRAGTIMPYRAQVSLVKRELKAQQLPDFKSKRINVGTVHAFQGSESDIIIWDLVETRFHRLGKLFHGNVGERLANVAISRAQGKLVIVGDPEAFFNAPGENLVAKKLRSILATHFSQGSENIISVIQLRL